MQSRRWCLFVFYARVRGAHFCTHMCEHTRVRGIQFAASFCKTCWCAGTVIPGQRDAIMQRTGQSLPSSFHHGCSPVALERRRLYRWPWSPWRDHARGLAASSDVPARRSRITFGFGTWACRLLTLLHRELQLGSSLEECYLWRCEGSLLTSLNETDLVARCCWGRQMKLQEISRGSLSTRYEIFKDPKLTTTT